MSTETMEPHYPLHAAWLRTDGTGYFYACLRCYFWKNTADGPCRKVGCSGTVERVEFVLNPPISRGDA